ncbi:MULTISPECIES: hypothetical protein [Pseudomonas]|uniref:DUF5666 domain-containing protein n=2 Tax=Pseudomonas chlororaphis TaxID=587753 RepID=A0AAP9VYT3_9PSED|nr:MULTISPECIES: hypothetical protein [Pseudomonas]AUG40297.1 hypothetical protein CXP47_10570 [Pseudomonas chlororaphis]AZD85176.1 hypothetical protein C4K14_2352 [Pseudomonas chlororaphis subsp. aureofaciens]AZD91623.1 hypothetical protein C4K13_2206 [Pseudomonas chlororaphis subsp. aureofaciens]AZE10497.1 hypothetical protein C4K10_2217 [Pseudomonas chlororaphis subsp. aureofaciens]AZE28957.1 hypothetical protein C4K07_2172 [Pseudomonas chlororaphis subsp. aureofaciens]
MKPLHSLAKAVALATLLSAASLHAHAADIPLAGTVEADELVTKVLSVDAAKHRVVLEGAQGQPVHVQLSDQAKDLGNLKVGDQVNVRVTHAVVAVLDTDVEKGLPNSAERAGVVRATKDNPNPGGEAYRQVQVQLKITDIDLKNNQLTFQGPAGNKKVLDVEKPEVQARLKDLKVGQSVVVTYTDVLQVTTQHEG